MKQIRFAALLLVLALVLTACAAGGKSPEAPAPATQEKTEPVQTEPSATEAPETEAPETEAPETELPETELPETEAPETEAPETEAPETEPENNTALPITGSVENNVYTNEYLNLRCEPASGWTYYSDEQIAELNNLSKALLKDSDIKDWIDQSGQYTDMYLSSNRTNGSANLMIQPMDFILKLYSDEELFTLAEEVIKSELEAAGIELTALEQVEVEFRGETVKALRMIISLYGIELEEYQIWIRPDGDYMGILTIGGYSGDDILPVLDFFSKLNG